VERLIAVFRPRPGNQLSHAPRCAAIKVVPRMGASFEDSASTSR